MPSSESADKTSIPVVTLADLPAPAPGKKGWPWTEASKPLPAELEGGSPWPAIGVVTPSYNQGRYIEETIRSVLLQGYPALEFYIEDGGSMDETVGIIRKYEKFLSGWVSEKDRGQSHAINKGMGRLRSAEWVQWLNSDDILLPAALEQTGRWAHRKTGAVAVIGKGLHHLERNGKTEPARAAREGITGTSIRNWRTHSFLQPCCFFSKAAFDACGGVNEALHYAMDFELWVKLGETGNFDLIHALIARDRDHPDAKTHSGMGEFFAEATEVLFSRGHNREGREMIQTLYQDFEYLARLVRPVAENRVYQNLIRPWVRRKFAPKHLRDDKS